MRNILIAMATVAGLGLLGTSGALAAPANGTVVRDVAAATSSLQDVKRWCKTWHREHSRREKECREGERRWW
jgi:hypothetical protein